MSVSFNRLSLLGMMFVELFACGGGSSEITYRLSGQGNAELTISYTDKNGSVVDEQSPRLPWEKKVTISDSDFEVELTASCSSGKVVIPMAINPSSELHPAGNTSANCSLKSGEILVDGSREAQESADTQLTTQVVSLTVECGWSGCN